MEDDAAVVLAVDVALALLEDDVDVVDPALVLWDCFSARLWLLELGIPRPDGVGMPEAAVGADP